MTRKFIPGEPQHIGEAHHMSTSPISVPIEEAAAMVGLSRRYLDLAIARGDLVAKKAGRKTIIEVDELRKYIEGMPDKEKGSAA